MSEKTKLHISILITLASYFIFHDSEATIELVSFTATAQDNKALIDNDDFYVIRSSNPAATYDDIFGFIPPEGVDEIGIQVTQTLSATLEPTSTSTSTPKPTKTSTSTLSPTPTNSRTPTPSRTSTPVTPSITPTHFTEIPTHTITPSKTPSATLLDAPNIVIKLPSTRTPTSIIQLPTPTSLLTATPQGIFVQMIETESITTIGVLCLLILVWASVAIGIFIFLQKNDDASD